MKTLFFTLTLLLLFFQLQAQTYLMGNRTDTVCNATFYDTGGPFGNYGSNQNLTHTFYPPNAGSRLTINFTGIFNITGPDVLIIYNGNSTNAPILGSYSGGFRPPTFTSTAPDGSLTFRFISDASFSRPGWTCNISCCTAPFPSTASSSVSSVCSGEPFSLSMSRYCGNLQWQVSTDSIVWQDIDTLNPSPSLTWSQSQTSYYRGKVSLADSTLYSNVLLVTTNCYKMGLSNNDTLCSGVFYDDAGPSALYSNNQNATHTFHPLPGNKLTVDFLTGNNFDINLTDTLYIYDGNNTTAPLLATMTGPFAPAAPFTSTAVDGSLTFKFVADASFNREGWTANFSCICDSNQLNNLSHAPIAPVCIGDAPILLAGASLSGGTYSGPGVVNGRFFDPNLAGVGNFALTYNFTAASGCSASIPVLVTVPLSYNNTTVAAICTGDSYLWNGNAYDSAGIYVDSFTTVNGCDSILTLNLTLYPPSSRDTTVATICAGDSYPWQGNSYSNAGFYTDTLLNANGCDSLVTLDLTLYTLPIRDTIVAAVCAGDSYFWQGNSYGNVGFYIDTLINSNGCDSILTLNLTFYPPSGRDTTVAAVCAGDSYFWQGNSYNNTGFYSDTLLNSNGCDSILTLNLSILPLPTVQITNVDSTYCDTSAAVTLVGTPAGGVFLDNGISGNQFDPAAASLGVSQIIYSYTDSLGCVQEDTATTTVLACNFIGILPLADKEPVLYPNPSTGLVFLEQETATPVLIEVFRENGQLVYQMEDNTTLIPLHLEEQSSGLYLVRMTTSSATYQEKIILIK